MVLTYEPSPYLGPLVAPCARRIEQDMFAFGGGAVYVKLAPACLRQQFTMRLRRREHKIICAEDAKKRREQPCRQESGPVVSRTYHDSLVSPNLDGISQAAVSASWSLRNPRTAQPQCSRPGTLRGWSRLLCVTSILSNPDEVSTFKAVRHSISKR